MICHAGQDLVKVGSIIACRTKGTCVTMNEHNRACESVGYHWTQVQSFTGLLWVEHKAIQQSLCWRLLSNLLSSCVLALTRLWASLDDARYQIWNAVHQNFAIRKSTLVLGSSSVPLAGLSRAAPPGPFNWQLVVNYATFGHLRFGDAWCHLAN